MSAGAQSGGVTIRPVADARDFQAFFEFPWRVYRDDPNWVPPLLSMRRDLLDRRRNPDWQHLEGDYFGAWRGGQLVGTIAAYVDDRHNRHNGEHIGWFGAFDVYDDPETAGALLETAADWVQARGCDAIVGPQTFSAHSECGLLVDGFVRPVLLMPYHPPYYQRLIEAAGFHKRADLYSFHMSRDQAQQTGLVQRLERLTAAVTRRYPVTIRPIDRKRLRQEFALFKDLYNTAWDRTWGFIPMTPAELDALVETLGRFFDPDFAFFAEVAGEPAGFVLGVPDYNQVLQKAAARPGVPEAITLLRALWHWKVRPVMNWLRIALLGVKHDYRGIGVDVALYAAIMRACLDSPRVEHSDSGWTIETNHEMVRIARNLGLNFYKTHRLYERRWAAPGAAP